MRRWSLASLIRLSALGTTPFSQTWTLVLPSLLRARFYE
jgi:hypothetical protein